MFFARLHSERLGAVCCLDSAALVHIACLVPLPAALCLVRVLPLCVVGPR